MPHVVEIRPGRDPSQLTVRLIDRVSDTAVNVTAECPAPVEPHIEEGIRWYLEEFPQYPFEPAPKIARGVERDIDRVGTDLFRAAFDSNDSARALWESIRSTVSDTTFHVALEGTGAADLPWELIRDPLDPVPLACRAEAFVRVPAATGADEPALPATRALRVLSVISRPGGTADVRFRSVAAHVLHAAVRQPMEFVVLRPSTFDALADAVHAAHAAGRPYSVLHFDGHGTYEDLVAKYADMRRQRPRGYLMFEDPDSRVGAEPIDGSTLGRLLVRYDVPIVMLNACRSARTLPAAADAETPTPERSFGSLAGELLAAGISAVVAMRYNVHVDTAARFVSDLYAQLASGQDLPGAVRRARAGLFADQQRSIGSADRNVSDWMVPMLFQASPVLLALPQSKGTSSDPLASEVRPPSTDPFVGRDDSLLEIHRLFGETRIVVLWGQSGIGKSATAAEYGRWFAATSGRESIVRMVRIDPHTTSATVIETMFSSIGARPGSIDPASLSIAEQQRVLIDAMAESPCLWVLDDFDTSSQNALATLVEDAAAGGISVLLTARSPLTDAFDDAASDVELPPLDDAERIELADAVGGGEIPFVPEIWRTLLERSRGNPSVLITLVRAVLREGIDSPTAMNEFINRLGTPGGGPLLPDTLVRTLRARFGPADQRQLALCAYFDGAINSGALELLRGFARGESPEVPTDKTTKRDLLDQAADLGVLSRDLNGWYGIHPGLQEFLGSLLVEHYTPAERESFEIGFVRLHAAISRAFVNNYESGAPYADKLARDTLGIAELSLRRALAMGREHAIWGEVIEVLGGLRFLLARANRLGDLAPLLDDVTADYLEPGSGLPRDGNREAWLYLQRCRVDLLHRARRLQEAEQLQRTIVEAIRVKNGPCSRQLADALHRLAGIERDRGSATCVQTNRAALDIAQRNGDHALEAAIAHALANFYASTTPTDLAAAEYWLTYGLDVVPAHDAVARGMLQLARGTLALKRFNESIGEADRNLEDAIRLMELGLDILPDDMAAARAAGFANLGLAYYSQGRDVGRSALSFERALHQYEQLGDRRNGAIARLNLARVYRLADDLERATLYAETALSAVASLAPHAEAEVVEAQELVASLATGRPEEGAKDG